MASGSHILSIVLAGGEGRRLAPLTKDRAKPAVPFGGQYRLIDFALSNLVNANLRRIIVLTQYKSHSLDRHLAQTWSLSPLLQQYITPVPAQMRLGPHWFAGSADAIYQNLNIIGDEDPDYVVVLGSDHDQATSQNWSRCDCCCHPSSNRKGKGVRGHPCHGQRSDSHVLGEAT